MASRGVTREAHKPGSKLRFRQIVSAAWRGADTGRLSYSILGLELDGSVWRYDVKCQGWIPYSMVVAPCEQHRR